MGRKNNTDTSDVLYFKAKYDIYKTLFVISIPITKTFYAYAVWLMQFHFHHYRVKFTPYVKQIAFNMGNAV